MLPNTVNFPQNLGLPDGVAQVSWDDNEKNLNLSQQLV